MDASYKEIIDRGRKNETLFKKLLARWRTLPPKHLDQTLDELQEKAFENIDCRLCANCCKSPGPLIRHREVEKLAKMMGQKPKVFAENYLRIDEDEDLIFQRLPCPFLGSDDLCNIYEDRPLSCERYPHLDEKKQSSRTKALLADSSICPAVVLVLETMLERSGILEAGQ